jgi:hypothetical protein
MTQMINSVRSQIYKASDDGPPSCKMPAMVWEVKEKIENTQKVGSLEMRTKYFPNTSSTKRQSTACTTNGANLVTTGTDCFQVAYYVDTFMDDLSKSLELAFAKPSGCVI